MMNADNHEAHGRIHPFRSAVIRIICVISVPFS
jgi:hypothetical protein